MTTAVANALVLGTITDSDKLLMQRKISDNGLGLRSMNTNIEFLVFADKTRISYLFGCTRVYLKAEPGYGLKLMDACNGAHTGVAQSEAQALLPK